MGNHFFLEKYIASNTTGDLYNMKRGYLIGIFTLLLTINFYIWFTLFNIADAKTLEGLLPFLPNDTIDKKDEHGWTPLMQASWDGDLGEVNRLLEKGADVNASESGSTSLHLAAQAGHLDIVKALLENGAIDSLDRVTEDTNVSPLYLAAEWGHSDIFKYLIEQGANFIPEQRNKLDGYTMLHAAVRYGKFEMVEYLLDEGFDPNVRDSDGQTPIMLIFGILDTTAEDLIRMINILVDNGAEINVEDHEGLTPLLLSYYEGKEPVTNYLIKLGAKGSIVTKDDAKEALKRLGIDTEEDYLREISFGNVGLVELFLKAGYDPNIWDERAGSTMLLQLVYPEELNMIELLLKNGADPNIKNGDGISPLWAAVSQNKPQIVKVLLQNRAENLANDAGWTPLMVAEDDGNKEIISLFDKYLMDDIKSSQIEGSSEQGAQNNDGNNVSSDHTDDSEYEEIPEFAVYQDNEILARFYTEEEAIDFAQQYENVEVWYPNSTIWDNKPSRVYQNDQIIGDYETKVEALEVASRLENAKVVNLITGKVEWDSYPRECRTCESAIQDQY
jgi:uncharacterized protein